MITLKEIKVSDHSTLPRIVGDQITIEEAKKRCLSGHYMIMTIVNNTWYQLITLSSTGHVEVLEQHHGSNKFTKTWENTTFELFVAHIVSMYPATEFYLIEGIQDIFQIIKDRIPNWLPTEYQNL
jgi:hypothetical protein